MIVDGHSFAISMNTPPPQFQGLGYILLFFFFYSLIYFFLGIVATKLLGNTLLQGK